MNDEALESPMPREDALNGDWLTTIGFMAFSQAKRSCKCLLRTESLGVLNLVVHSVSSTVHAFTDSKTAPLAGLVLDTNEMRSCTGPAQLSAEPKP